MLVETLPEPSADRKVKVRITATGTDVSHLVVVVGTDAETFLSFVVWDGAVLSFNQPTRAPIVLQAVRTDAPNFIDLEIEGATVNIAVNAERIPEFSVSGIEASTQVSVGFEQGSGTLSTLEVFSSTPIPTWLWSLLGITVGVLIVVGILGAIAGRKKS